MPVFRFPQFALCFDTILNNESLKFYRFPKCMRFIDCKIKIFASPESICPKLLSNSLKYVTGFRFSRPIDTERSLDVNCTNNQKSIVFNQECCMLSFYVCKFLRLFETIFQNKQKLVNYKTLKSLPTYTICLAEKLGWKNLNRGKLKGRFEWVFFFSKIN